MMKSSGCGVGGAQGCPYPACEVISEQVVRPWLVLGFSLTVEAKAALTKSVSSQFRRAVRPGLSPVITMQMHSWASARAGVFVVTRGRRKDTEEQTFSLLFDWLLKLPSCKYL